MYIYSEALFFFGLGLFLYLLDGYLGMKSWYKICSV